jgi:hypothetical protein
MITNQNILEHSKPIIVKAVSGLAYKTIRQELITSYGETDARKILDFVCKTFQSL